MAIAKYKSIKFGPGSYTNKNGESEWFIEQRAPVDITDGKDGDVWVQVPVAGFPAGGADVEMYIKSSNAWQGIKGTPVIVSLTDGQVASAVALEIPAAAFRYAKVEYTVKRSVGRKRKGTLEILNDGSSPNPTYSHEYIELGSNVNVPFTVDYSGGKVRVLYTSTLEGIAIECKYTIKGWE